MVLSKEGNTLLVTLNSTLDVLISHLYGCAAFD